MSTTPLRFAVVGCGAIATLHHLPALRRTEGARLSAVVDRDVAWARRVARRFAAETVVTDVDELAGLADAALVATPNTTHADIACRLLERGIHVLCEKPLAPTWADAHRMLAAARRGNARLMAAQCLRFSANMSALHDLVREGRLGPIRSIAAAIGAPYDAGAQRTDFRRLRAQAGGGVLLDLGVHVLDLMRWFLGSAPTTFDYRGTTQAGWEVETDAEVSLTYPGDVTAGVHASFTRTLDNAITVRGDDGWARASLYLPGQLVVFAPRARICRRAGMQTLLLDDVGMYDAQLAHFCAAVRDGTAFVVRDAEVRDTLDVVDRCYAQCAVAA